MHCMQKKYLGSCTLDIFLLAVSYCPQENVMRNWHLSVSFFCEIAWNWLPVVCIVWHDPTQVYRQPVPSRTKTFAFQFSHGIVSPIKKPLFPLVCKLPQITPLWILSSNCVLKWCFTFQESSSHSKKKLCLPRSFFVAIEFSISNYSGFPNAVSSKSAASQTEILVSIRTSNGDIAVEWVSLWVEINSFNVFVPPWLVIQTFQS